MSHYDKKESVSAFSRKLVEANGGRIEVQSEAGRGPMFTIWLPLAKGIQR